MVILGYKIPSAAQEFFDGEWTVKWLRNRDGDVELPLTPIYAAERVIATFDPHRCWEHYTGNQAEFWALLKNHGFAK